jgi:hypothetical protein
LESIYWGEQASEKDGLLSFPGQTGRKEADSKKNSGKYKTHKNSKSSQELKSSGNAGTLLSVSRTHLCFAMRDSPVRIEKAV